MNQSYRQWLNQLLQEVFEAATDEEIGDMSLAEFARHCKLSSSTVYKLHKRRTKQPRISTVYKMCKAIGMDLNMMEVR